MTWEDSPYAHVLTEFAFDTLEVVAGHVAPQNYHEWIGFRVPSPLLQRAFRKTYGLELKDQTVFLRLALFSYRTLASRLIPEMTEVAWAIRGKPLEERATSLHHRSLFHLQRASIEAKWEKTRKRPGPGDKVTAWVFRLVPKFGPLNAFDFHTPTEETATLFADSLRATVEDYGQRVKEARFDPPNVNLDTGKPTRLGDYGACDQVYAQLLHKLQRTRFALMTPALRDNLMGFYREPARVTLLKRPRTWRHVQHDLEELKAASMVRGQANEVR